MPGMGELLIILAIVLVVFGANKLPGIGDALGRSIKNFKRASAGEDKDEDEKEPKGKQLSGGKKQQQIESGGDDDGEWEEVVVRRRKKAGSASES